MKKFSKITSLLVVFTMVAALFVIIPLQPAMANPTSPSAPPIERAWHGWARSQRGVGPFRTSPTATAAESVANATTANNDQGPYGLHDSGGGGGVNVTSFQLGTNNLSATGDYREAWVMFELTEEQVDKIKSLNPLSTDVDEQVLFGFVPTEISAGGQPTWPIYWNIYLVPAEITHGFLTYDDVENTYSYPGGVNYITMFQRMATARDFLRFINPDLPQAELTSSSNIRPPAARAGVSSAAGLSGEVFFNITAALQAYLADFAVGEVYDDLFNDGIIRVMMSISCLDNNGILASASVAPTMRLYVPTELPDTFEFTVTANNPADTVAIEIVGTRAGYTINVTFESNGNSETVSGLAASSAITLFPTLNVPFVVDNDSSFNVVIEVFNSNEDLEASFDYFDEEGGLLTLNTFRVHFDSRGGNLVPRIRGVADNAIITEPSEPTREYNEFIGWFRDRNLRQEWNFDTDYVSDYAGATTGILTLYAGWLFDGGTPESARVITQPSLMQMVRSDGGIYAIPDRNDFAVLGNANTIMGPAVGTAVQIGPGGGSPAARRDVVFRYDLSPDDITNILSVDGSTDERRVTFTVTLNGIENASGPEPSFTAFLIPADKVYDIHLNHPQRWPAMGVVNPFAAQVPGIIAPLNQNAGLSAFDMLINEMSAAEFLRYAPQVTVSYPRSGPFPMELSFDFTDILQTYFGDPANAGVTNFAFVLTNLTTVNTLAFIHGTDQETRPKLFIPAEQTDVTGLPRIQAFNQASAPLTMDNIEDATVINLRGFGARNIPGGVAENVTTILAFYDGNNRMIDYLIVPTANIQLQNAQTFISFAGGVGAFTDVAAASSARIMFLEGFNTLRPLARILVIE